MVKAFVAAPTSFATAKRSRIAVLSGTLRRSVIYARELVKLTDEDEKKWYWRDPYFLASFFFFFSFATAAAAAPKKRGELLSHAA